MPIPDYQSLMLPMLQITVRGETSVSAVETEVTKALALPPEECEQLLPSGRQRVLNNRLHWAKFYLTKAGYLESSKRGRFTITPSGRALLKTAPEKLDTQFLLTVPAFREFYRADRAGETTTELTPGAALVATPEEMIETAFKATQTALRAELLERILQNNPSFFEVLIIDLLVAMGYGGSHQNAAEQLGRSGDGGVDGVINEDILGLDRLYVQAKRYSPNTSVGRPDVQAFTGSLVGLGATKGVFVTTSTFSTGAIEFAARIPQRVILIDGKRLTELMIEHGVGVRTSRVLEFKRLDEDFFVEG